MSERSDSQELSTVVNFKKPYFIDVLGEEGLTAKDIAEALQVDLNAIHQKIRREHTRKDVRVFSEIAYTVANSVNGLQFETYALNTQSAKAFIARWKNYIGDAYLNFLFECEKVATELTPKLMEEISSLKVKLTLAEAQVIQTNKKLLKSKKEGNILAPVYYNNPLLEVVELKWEIKRKADLDEVAKLKAEVRHMQKVIRGLSSGILTKEELLDKKELQKKNNLIKLLKD